MALRYISRRVGFFLKYDLPKRSNIRRKSILSRSTIFYPESLGCLATRSLKPIRNIHRSTVSNELIRFNLADIGEGIKEVAIKEWYIKVGDTVSQFDNICEVQSDKAAVTITSRYDGIVRKIYYDIDDVALVGHPLIDIEVGGSSASTSNTTKSSSSEYTFDVSESPTTTGQSSMNFAHVLTTPTVRKMAKDHSLDLTLITPTGPNGRILKEDVLAYLSNKSGATVSAASATSATTQNKLSDLPMKSTAPTMPTSKLEQTKSIFQTVQLKEDKLVKLTAMERAMYKSMTAASYIPHFTYSDEVNVSNLVQIRQSIKHILHKKFTFMPFFIKAASVALLKYPQLNAQIDSSESALIYKSSHNIGFALATTHGLIVPKIHNVEKKSILEIDDNLQLLIDRGKSNKLTQQDLSNGTFTLSNIGNVGGTYTKPVILPPEIVIGGIGKIQKLPRYNYKDELEQHHIMPISWSADHRVVDGITIALFSNEWRHYLQNPELLLIHLK